MTLAMWIAILIAGVGGSAAVLYLALPDLARAASNTPES